MFNLQIPLLRNLGLHQREYEWDDTGGLISNDVPTML